MTYAVALMWAALLLGGAFRPGVQGAGTPGAQPGQVAPPVSLRDLDGNAVSLADYRGRAVFLNFWASWCGPCRLEMPEIERLAADLPPGAAILTVNATNQEASPDAASAYMQAHGYTFAVALDPEGKSGHDYRVLSLPTSLFISPDGVVTARINGPLSRGAMADYLRAAGRDRR